MFFDKFLLNYFVLCSLVCLFLNALHVHSQCVCGVFRRQTSATEESVNILNCNVSNSDLSSATSTNMIDRSARCAEVTRAHLSTSGSVDIADGCFVQFKNLTYLYLFDGDFPTLRREQFEGLTSLTMLQFYRGTIGSVQSAAFANIPNLEYLSLYNVKHLAANSIRDYNNLRSLSISFHSSVDIPNNVRQINLPSLEDLHISSVNLKVLDLDMFSTTNWTSLLSFSIFSNSIETISTDRTNWTVFPKLKKLHLTCNELKHLHEDTFIGLTKVEFIALAGSQLKEFSSTWFRHSVNLKELQLSDIDLSSLPQNAFQNLTNLEVLDLWNNNIKEISSSVWPKNIKRIFLGQNKITTLNKDQFSNLNSLEKLHFFDNEIREILNCTFCFGLNNLRSLGFEYNPYATLFGEELFDGLLNSSLVIDLRNKTFHGPMNHCSDSCYSSETTRSFPTTSLTTTSLAAEHSTSSSTRYSTQMKVTTNSPTSSLAPEHSTSSSTLYSTQMKVTTNSPTSSLAPEHSTSSSTRYSTQMKVTTNSPTSQLPITSLKTRSPMINQLFQFQKIHQMQRLDNLQLDVFQQIN